MKNYAVYLLVLVIVTACTSTQSSDEVEKREYLEQLNQVDYKVLSLEDFEQEFISNGKLKAKERVVIKSKVGGQIRSLNVKNGDNVKSGSVLMVLKQEEYKRAIEDATIAIKKTKVDLFDFLLGQGYKVQDSAMVPDDLWELAAIRSGYSAAENQLEQAQYELAHTIIRAPFNGKIANLQVSLHDQLGGGEEICAVINDRQMAVVFHLVETEIHHIKVNDKINVVPFAINDTVTGKVTEINPLVDENGMVEVKALISNNGKLLDGMQVKVSVKKAVSGQLVVPREAVVLRQNQEVLFRYTDGTAYWTYVQTGLENSRQYTVMAHPDKGASLKPGDTVIISNNLNLAHESKVELR